MHEAINYSEDELLRHLLKSFWKELLFFFFFTNGPLVLSLREKDLCTWNSGHRDISLGKATNQIWVIVQPKHLALLAPSQLVSKEKKKKLQAERVINTCLPLHPHFFCPQQPPSLSHPSRLLHSGLPHLCSTLVHHPVIADVPPAPCTRSLPALPALRPVYGGAIRQGSHTVKYTLKLQECQTALANLPEGERERDGDAPWRHNNRRVCRISISIFCLNEDKSHRWDTFGNVKTLPRNASPLA